MYLCCVHGVLIRNRQLNTCNRVLLEKLIVAQINKNLLVIYSPGMFIIVLTRALTMVNNFYGLPSIFIKILSNILLPHTTWSSAFVPSGLPVKNL
jgi:hypothetical protein